MEHCKLCVTGKVSVILDLGLQPITSRFLMKSATVSHLVSATASHGALVTASHPASASSSHSAESTEVEYRHHLSLGQCQDCGLLQLTNFPPANELKPIYDWITYREEEDHLDAVADSISSLPGIHRGSRIMGVSYKDDSLLQRLQRKGFDNSRRLNANSDFGIADNRFGVEVVQGKLTIELAKEIVQRYGPQDLVLARHILEHAHGIREFITALRILTAGDGYVIIEVPDCSKAFDLIDYSIIWEEHLFYFTPASLKHSLVCGGFSLFDYREYPFPFENCLVSIWKPTADHNNPDAVKISRQDLFREKKRAEVFSNSFLGRRDAIKTFLLNYKADRGSIALLGAGHLAAGFINFLGLENEISFIADDNPVKQGLLMAGSQLPIFSSSCLLKEKIKLCLLGLNPRKESLIINNHQQFIASGGQFFSIFSESSLFLPIGNGSPIGNGLLISNGSLIGNGLLISNGSPIGNGSLISNGPMAESAPAHSDTGQNLVPGNSALKEINPAVFSADADIVKISSHEIDFISGIAAQNVRSIARICAHNNAENSLHEMMIVLGRESYIRPHKHPGKSESFHMIRGAVEVIIFDDLGGVIEIIELGEYSSGRNFYYRLSKPYFHTVRAISDRAVFHETTNGPFNKMDTEFASWAPDGEGWENVKQFMRKISRRSNEPGIK